MSSGGASCTQRSTFSGNSNTTFIFTYNPIDSNGQINQFCIHIRGSGAGTRRYKLKIFRNSGNNYLFVGESDIVNATVNQSSTFVLDAPINVLAGDFIGVYMYDSDGAIDIDFAGGSPSYSQSGDIISNSPKANWYSSITAIWSLKVSLIITGGANCVSRSTTQAGGITRTWLMTTSPISGDGSITDWCILLISGAGSIKLKVFRSDGTNFIFVGEGPTVTAYSGVNSFSLPTPITVKNGDIIGFYKGSSDFAVPTDSNGTGSAYVKDGDISSNYAISSWVPMSFGNWFFSIKVTGCPKPSITLTI